MRAGARGELTGVLVCQGDEGARDVPPSVEADHFGLHVPIGRLQRRNRQERRGKTIAVTTATSGCRMEELGARRPSTHTHTHTHTHAQSLF